MQCTSAQIEDSISVQDYNECYNGILDLQDRFYDNNTRATIINNGTRENTYLLQVFATNEIDNATFTLQPGSEKTFVLNQLMLIHDEYKVDSFSVGLKGTGVLANANTTFYDNRITGMVVTAATNSSLYLGVTALLFLIYAFIRKK